MTCRPNVQVTASIPDRPFIAYKVVRRDGQPYYMGFDYYPLADKPPISKPYAPGAVYHAVDEQGNRVPTTIEDHQESISSGVHVFLHKYNAKYWRKSIPNTLLIKVECDPVNLIGAGHGNMNHETAVFTEVRVKTRWLMWKIKQLRAWMKEER